MSRAPTTSFGRSSTTSGSRTAPPTSLSPGRVAPFGSWPRLDCPRCSCRAPLRPATTRRRTRGGSRTRVAPSSCRNPRRRARRGWWRNCSATTMASRRCPSRCARSRSPMQRKKSRMNSSPLPFAGRRIWIAGIGGAGMSGYALLARAWGAEVAGWDRVETPYLRHLEGVAIEISPEPPQPPSGWDAYVSSAFAGQVEGRTRAELLAELVSVRRAIVVAGAHGKTTTSAMIAFCLDRLGLDPAFLIGGEIPQLDGNARAGEGWLVVEGDESDRSVGALEPEIAVLLNVDLDHHTEFASRAEVETFFGDWLAGVAHVVRAEQLEPVALELAVPGEHNRRNAAAALAALELAGVDGAEGVIVEFTGVGRRLQPRGENVFDSYAPHPAEIAADIAAVERPVIALFQPHLYSRTLYLAHEFAVALAAADAVCVTGIYPAREEPIPGVSGRLIVDELARVRPGMRVGWAPTLEDGARIVAGWRRQGDTVLTLGAGDVDRAAELV